MNFEDIVDMEWVDTNTTLDEGNEFSDLFFNQQADFLLEQPVTPQQETIPPPEIKMEPLLTTMPTTEQIKQLIEVAKQQLALREQLQLLQQQQPQTTTTKDNASPQQSSLFSQIPTVAPSTIFAPPSDVTPAMPALSPSTIASTDMTLVPPTNVDSTQSSQQSLSASSKNTKRRDSLASVPEEAISLEAYAEADGIDLKSLTSKERRQLRNKISARNFRVRRKEYISTLEGQVNQHKQKAEELKEKLTQVENENKQLRKEMDSLKRQNQQLLQQQHSPRISSPLPKPNLNKDISIMGTKATDSYRQQDNYILVSNAIMPDWDYKSILEKPIESSTPNMLHHLAGQYILMVLKLALAQQEEYQPPLLPDDRDFSSSSHNMKHSTTYPSTLTTNLASSSYMEYLYDTLIQSALTNNATADKSFLWA